MESSQKTRLFRELERNLDYMYNDFQGSVDYTVKRFVLKDGQKCAAITMEGQISKDIFARSVLNPILTYDTKDLYGDELFDCIKLYIISASEAMEITSFEEVYNLSMSGFAIIAVDDCDRMLAVGVQGFPFRSISEPETEITQRGSREGFVEPIKINMTMIRRRIKNPRLKFEQMIVGDVSKTSICLCYLTDIVSQDILNELKKRLEQTDLSNALAAGYLVDYLDDKNDKSLFCSVGLSERPDTVCGKISEGRIAVVIDGTPSVLIVPHLFVENFQTMDDYSNRPYFATFSRWLKYLAFIISIFTPGVYVAAVIYNPEIFPEEMLTKIALSVASTPFPIVWEVLIIHFIYEIMREAGLRLPRTLGHAVSIVGALVIGETAVNAGLIGAPTLMIVALTAISSYVIPDLYAPISLMRILFIVIGGLFGIWGIMAVYSLIMVDLCAKNSFGVPYTAPLSPFSIRGMRDSILKAGWKRLSRKKYIVSDTKGFERDLVS
ncbi:MAG: spore germination protein [Clostridia bacterium]|nr:spore germination protein [Clostridia bacterium]